MTTTLRHEEGGAPETGEPKLTIRIIHRCNFRCPACSTFSGPEGVGVLRLEDFCLAIDLLAEENFHGIVNISGGETTLHPSLPEMLRHASERLPRSRIAVFTHGHWVGRKGWRRLLSQLMVGPNVLIRFSLDRQHAEGLVYSRFGEISDNKVGQIESDRLHKAKLFLSACRERNAVPGRTYDFAFKGTLKEGRNYTASLGEVPLYLITFRPDPTDRAKKIGFFALDVDDDHRPVVFQTLGHIPVRESLGGIETLVQALEWNRKALRSRSQNSVACT